MIKIEFVIISFFLLLHRHSDLCLSANIVKKKERLYTCSVNHYSLDIWSYLIEKREKEPSIAIFSLNRNSNDG